MEIKKLRKISLIINLIFLIYIPTIYSQPDTLWTKTYGGSNWDNGYSVQQTADGGFIITGSTYSYGVGNSDIWLIKTGSIGNEIWNQTFSGNKDDIGNSVQQTIDGGYVITGWTTSFGYGSYEVWLIKTDTNGNEVWNKTFGGSHVDLDYSVQQTADSGYIFIG